MENSIDVVVSEIREKILSEEFFKRIQKYWRIAPRTKM